jgi:UDP-N-acetylmuramate dehydrogenase
MTKPFFAPALALMLARLGAQYNEPLTPFTTMRVGGCAKALVYLPNLEALAELQLALSEHQVPWHILGGGSNTLYSDRGFNGVVIKLGPQFAHIESHEQTREIITGASASYAKVAKLAIAMGFPKAVGFTGVPGVIGGAVRMNAGTRLGVIGDYVERVEGVFAGQPVVFSRSDISFSYRKTSLPADLFITRVLLKCHEENTPRPELPAMVEEYRKRRRATQPSEHSAGSFFKNPQNNFAGALIENCQLKGFAYGGAQISPVHANFIINRHLATTHDILHIASLAQQRVHEQFGVDLVPEIHLVGEFDEQPLRL